MCIYMYMHHFGKFVSSLDAGKLRFKDFSNEIGTFLMKLTLSNIIIFTLYNEMCQYWEY